MTQEITIRRIGPEALEWLMAVPAGLFDRAIDPVWARAFLEREGNVLFLAFAGDLAVGMASGTVLLHPDKPPSLFVNEVGTRDGYLRRGIARALMQALLDWSASEGHDGAWLGTETENFAARGLYTALGATEMIGVFYGWGGALDPED